MDCALLGLYVAWVACSDLVESEMNAQRAMVAGKLLLLATV